MSSTGAPQAAKSPPPGQQSNFIDPPSVQPVVIFVLTLELFVATASMLARCFAQWSLFKKLVWADFWALLGWAFEVVFVGLLFDCLPYGGGRHLWDVTKQDFAHIQYILFIDYIIYGCAILGAKISILLQLIAIFVPRGRNLAVSTRIFFWTAWTMITINVVFYVSHNFLLIFQCRPIAKGWDPKIPGKCLAQFSLIESSAPFNIISDIMMVILPLFTISRLRLPQKTKYGAASAFAVGLFGCICSGVRLSYSDRLAKSGDITYLVLQNQLWANAEIAIALLIANVIILPRFFRTRRTKLRGYNRSYDRSDRSRSRSFALQGGLKSPKGQRAMELYMGLNDSQTKTLHEDANQPVIKSYQAVDDAAYGITRTVEIERTEEGIQLPGRAITANSHSGLVTKVTTNN